MGNHVVRKLEKRQQDHKLDPHIEEQFGSSRLLAAISSYPGQCGHADGFFFARPIFNTYILLGIPCFSRKIRPLRYSLNELMIVNGPTFGSP